MISKTGSWTVPQLEGRIRLDQLMVRLLPGESRSQIQNWIRSGCLLVNGKEVKTGEVLKKGDRIELELPAVLPEIPYPEDLPIKILYRDEDLAVIEKPSGMVCHSGAGVRSGTLVNALLYHLGPLQSVDPMRPGIVHRLDKPTSGLLVVARNTRAHRELSQQFKSRKVTKIYLALVYGKPEPSVGTIDLPLGRDPVDRKRFSIRARRRRRAITHYSVAREAGPFSLLEVRIETGRTHQIRVHLAQKGYPIVGDTLYGGRRDTCIAPAIRSKMPGRLFLHAHRLEFHHPVTGAVMRFTSPMPQELEQFLAEIAGLSRPQQPRR